MRNQDMSSLEFARRVPLGNNFFEFTIQALGLNPQDLVATLDADQKTIVYKRILDVGCFGGFFVRGARSVGAKVWGIEPMLANSAEGHTIGFEPIPGAEGITNFHEFLRKVVTQTYRAEGKEYGIGPHFYPPLCTVAAAIVQALPFVSNFFDKVVSYSAVPYYLPAADFGVALAEMLRVLKPGGKIHLSPMPIEGKYFAIPDPNSHSINNPYGPSYIECYFDTDHFISIVESVGLRYELVDYDFGIDRYSRDRAMIITKPVQYCQAVDMRLRLYSTTFA